jgi:DNA helicase-2/ATP-dependent DNA helicase PcrA
LVALLSKNNGNLFIVGDPDQTIYSFRGANVNFFLDFDKKFKDVKTIILDTNYRSTPQILNASNALIVKNTKRIEKQLKPVKVDGVSVEYYHSKTRKDECEYIAKQIAEIVKKGGSLSDCAVLYRNNNNSRAIEEALIRNKLPYVIFSGFAFYKRKEIKDVIAYLEMAETTDDVSFLRTVNLPARGIGKTRLAYLREEAEAYGISLYTALKNNRFRPPFVGTGASEYVELVESIKDLKEKYSINDLLDYILKETGYEKMLMEDGDQERLDNVAELKDSIREYETEAKEKVALSDYLNNVALIASSDRNDKADCVKMMTVHTAKGLEFKNVFVCQLNEGIFPSSQTNTLEEMEEERRLMYVAMTRAEERLVLTDCEINSGGQMQLAPSRFIFDIDENAFIRTGLISPNYTEWAKEYISRLNPKPPIQTENAKFKVGDTVVHEILGRGTVEKIIDGAYRIRFEGNRMRTISFRVELKK